MFHYLFHNLGRPFVYRISMATACLSIFVAVGCSGGSLLHLEVKEIDEKITDGELEAFLEIIAELPDEKLPDFPTIFAPRPQWSPVRTLPINELSVEEMNKTKERWNKELLARHLDKNKKLQRVLRRKEVTSEQFIGLSLAIAIALSRNALRDEQDLKNIIRNGETQIKILKGDERRFSSLNPEGMHAVLQRAVWITRTNRAKILALVPPENLALVRLHNERLASIFPSVYTDNPLDPVADRLAEKGLPFEEMPSTGFDDQIDWNQKDAANGRDKPDPPPQKKPKAKSAFGTKQSGPIFR